MKSRLVCALGDSLMALRTLRLLREGTTAELTATRIPSLGLCFHPPCGEAGPTLSLPLLSPRMGRVWAGFHHGEVEQGAC